MPASDISEKVISNMGKYNAFELLAEFLFFSSWPFLISHFA